MAGQGGGRQAQPSWQNWSTRGTNTDSTKRMPSVITAWGNSSALDRDFLNEPISHDLVNIGCLVNLFVV